ncbi:hypothetical protein VE23_23295 [Paenibacillus sp. D9]|uniref:DUF4097 family beta strand repeat-containing protein n=1 Tax=Paenibacillus TaxID=44249 RepID=UPI00061F8613|nr:MULTISPECIES: DUF6677 family protein [Paenibacillus]KKC49337.1 hypothetical protein VE23_23295 [Paenibacillus sp. D9]
MNNTQFQPKRRWLAGLLAFLLPGGGHLYIGRYGRGLVLLLAVLLDLAALVRFSDATSGSRALLLVYLGMALPALYFVSVFDALQIASRTRLSEDDARLRPEPAGFAMTHSMILVAGGIILFFLIRPTRAVQPRLDWLGDMASGVILLIIAAWMAFRIKPGFFRFGRLSSAALLAACGVLLLWDQAAGRNDIGLLADWWPLLFVLAGFEMLVYQLLERKKPGRRLSAGAGSLLAALLLAGSAYSITQYGGLPFRWLDQYGTGARMENLSEEKGYSYSLKPVSAVITEPLNDVVVDNPNGDVSVVPSTDPDSREVTVEATLWVDSDNKQEADLVEQKSAVSVSAEGKLHIETKGMPYGANGARMPRFNLQITIPADLETLLSVPGASPSPGPLSAGTALPGENVPDGTEPSPSPQTDAASPSPPPAAPEQTVKFLLNAGNGSVKLSGIRATGGFVVRNRSGSIEAMDLTGPLEAGTSNGEVKARRITGDAALSAKEGAITASSIHGKLTASTANGNLDINDVRGEALLETRNGFIHVREVSGSVQADTLNGEISLASSVVGGTWDINSSIGEILLSLPADGSYTVDGSVTFGTIRSELPLQIEKKTVKGQIGLGTYRIRVDANSDIRITSYPGPG